ncbi:MAG: winged helix-turn-helix domain-containing protein [Thermonemataceae bacterium]
MKELLKEINKAFDNKIRLAIMSSLMSNESLTFNQLKRLLGATDGNLSSNATVLEEKEYIVIQKKFVRKKSNTSYTATEKGKNAYKVHVEALMKIIQNNY